MASELRVNTLKDASGNNSVGMSTVAEGTNKCWINHDQTSDTTNDSFNTASVTDVSSGRAKWNVTNAFSNTNGALSGATSRTGIPNFSGGNGVLQTTTSQWEIFTTNNSDANSDCVWGATGIGDLA